MIIKDKKGHIAAVCPACIVTENGERKLISHMGSTFGGLVIAPKHYYAHKVIEMIQQMESYLKQEGGGIAYIELRITPDLFSQESSALLEYCLFYCGYQCFDELSTYIDFDRYKQNILSNFDQGKRTNINNCVKRGLICRELENENEIKIFYHVLCQNLLKYNARPVHSLEELLDLKRNRIPEEMQFLGIFNEETMIAGAMLFWFRRAHVVHTQYLCADQHWNHLSPMSYMYFSAIKETRDRGEKKISFGISTEDKGRILNYGLTRSKEAYGGKHCLNKKFCKML